MNTNDPRFELIRLCHDGEASAEELAQFEGLLRDDADFRDAYVRYINLDAALGTVANVGRMPASPPTNSFPRRGVWLQWRPLTAAAAGLVFGLLGAGLVFGFATPKPFKAVPVFAAGFENSPTATRRAFPLAANEWGGDLSAAVGAEGKVTPAEGSRMVRLMKSEKAKRRLSYAWRIVDLAELPAATSERPLRIEVTAAFAGSEPERAAHYQIRLAAFSQAPAEVRALWNNEPLLFDTVLQHVGRNVHTEPGMAGWQTVQAGMQIPAGTRSIVISLGAGDEAADSALPSAHYLDDVRASFVITRTPAE